MVKVAIIEDNEMLRHRLKQMMEKSDQLECVMAVESVEKFIRYYRDAIAIDLILSDISLPGISGIEGISKLRKIQPEFRIIMLTIHHEPDKIFQAICNGASGYLLKDLSFEALEFQLLSIHEKGGAVLSPQIARRVMDYFRPNTTHVLNSEIDQLTDRESQIIRFIVDGLTYQQTADKLNLTIDGVRYHIKNIYKKLQVSSKAEVIRKFSSRSKP